MADTPSPLELKSAGDIRDDICRTYRAELITLGVENPNVTPGSDIYVLAQAIGNQLEIGMANVQVMADRAMPDTATGVELDRLVSNMPMDPRKAATGARGFIVYDATAATVIAAGEQLTGPNGFRYAVDTTASYADGASIAITGVDAGEDSNLGAGEALRWVTIPAFASPTALVDVGGLDGGREDEGDEELRARLLAVYREPPRSGNTSDCIRLAEESSPTVGKAFCYPVIQGPGTFAVAVAAPPTDTSKQRDIATATVTGTIKPYIDGNIPEHAYSIVNTVTNLTEDVAIGIALPSAKTASPSGPGGGWKDGTPWPTYVGNPCRVQLLTTPGTRFTVSCQAAPVEGVTQIAWLSNQDWKVYRAKVITLHSFATNEADITIDRAFPDVNVDSIISPDAENIETYFQAVLDAFAKMGPGELTANAAILAYAYRRPRISVEWPSTTGTHILRALEDSADEVSSAQFIYRLVTDPGVPGAVTSPPIQLVPDNIGLYPVQNS
jgi:uncharacterized phage protein gp47/JayE